MNKSQEQDNYTDIHIDIHTFMVQQELNSAKSNINHVTAKLEAVTEIRGLNSKFINGFYAELDSLAKSSPGKLPSEIHVRHAIYDTFDTNNRYISNPVNKVSCESEPIIQDVVNYQCKLTADFIQARGFPYKLSDSKISTIPIHYDLFTGDLTHPARTAFKCVFNLQK